MSSGPTLWFASLTCQQQVVWDPWKRPMQEIPAQNLRGAGASSDIVRAGPNLLPAPENTGFMWAHARVLHVGIWSETLPAHVQKLK